MTEIISTRDVCVRANLTESALRHILRRPGAPRPSLHPTAHVFLWKEDDVRGLLAFLGGSMSPSATQEARHVAP